MPVRPDPFPSAPAARPSNVTCFTSGACTRSGLTSPSPTAPSAFSCIPRRRLCRRYPPAPAARSSQSSGDGSPLTPNPSPLRGEGSGNCLTPNSFHLWGRGAYHPDRRSPIPMKTGRDAPFAAATSLFNTAYGSGVAPQLRRAHTRQTKNPRLFAVGLVFRVVKTSLSDRLGDHLTERRPFFFQTLVLDLFELRRRDLEFLGHDFIRFPHVMNIVLGGNQGL